MKIQQTRNTLSKTYLDAMRIRQAVFVKGQGVPKNMEIDAFEAHCIHFVLYDQHNYAIATCRLLPNKDYSQVSLQRMAVLEAYQRQGLGKKLLKNVLDFCQQQDFDKITLHAQVSAAGFYQSFGFQKIGKIFEEAGIDHITMGKELT